MPGAFGIARICKQHRLRNPHPLEALLDFAADSACHLERFCIARRYAIVGADLDDRD